MTEMGEGLKTDEKRALIEKMMTEKSRLERAIVHHGNIGTRVETLSGSSM